jgi:type IV pilus assembly protein PilW
MNTPRNRANASTVMNLAHRQAGFTLMEAMISLALSLLVTSAMVILMANSLGTASRLIQMTQLTDELRNTMSMLTRDVRRANYSANAAFCYANSDCGVDGSANQFADISISNNNCFIFGLDRNFNGNAATDDAGGFRLRTTGGIGRVEMWVGGAAPTCAGNSADWVQVTDPDFVDITAFVVGNADSFSGSIPGEGGTTITQFTRQIDVQLAGRLIRDNTITRAIQDEIRVRNNVIVKT